MAEPVKTYVIRVGKVSGSTFTGIHIETATQTFTSGVGEYMTWTFDSPVPLSANTTYAVDIGMTGSTSSYETGIPYLNCTADKYAGGVQYTSGKKGVGEAKIRLQGGHDRIFHLKLESTTAPSTPAPTPPPSPPPPAPGAPANFVTPVAVTASSWWSQQTPPHKLIDGSGLSANAPAEHYTSGNRRRFVARLSLSPRRGGRWRIGLA